MLPGVYAIQRRPLSAARFTLWARADDPRVGADLGVACSPSGWDVIEVVVLKFGVLDGLDAEVE